MLIGVPQKSIYLLPTLVTHNARAIFESLRRSAIKNLVSFSLTSKFSNFLIIGLPHFFFFLRGIISEHLILANKTLQHLF